MKKYHLYLWIVALVGLITSCSQDETDALPTDTNANRVTLTASLPADFAQPQPQSRALPTPPANHQLRCILEVWTQDPTSPALKYREEKVGLTGDNVVFDFTIDKGKYDCLFWADFIETGAKGFPATIGGLSCTHYDDSFYATNNATNGLKAISIIENAYFFNTDARDAFFGHYVLNKETAAVTNPSIPALTRPFAKLTIKEKNATNYGYCSGLTATYDVPTTFNALDGTVSGTAQVTCNSKSAESQTLFSDYILTEASSTLGEIELTFTGVEGKELQPVTIPAGIPLKRNYKTNAAGSLISEEPVPIKNVKLTVDINSDWTTPDKEYDALARNILDPAKTAGSGDKAEDYHYTIATAEQLAALSTLANAGAVITGCTTAKYSDANYKLNQNIDLKNEPWTPIDMFFGTFDGQGNTISNMKVSITSQSTSEIFGGLFGVLLGTVSNLIVEGEVTVNGGGNCSAGGICGRQASETIKFCRFNGTVSATTTNNDSRIYAGGITGGYSGIVTITGCIANAKVTISGGNPDKSGVGGLAGSLYGPSCKYSAWNNDSNKGTSNMIDKNDEKDGKTGTGNNSFTDISGLNSLLSGINDGVSESTYIWQAGDSGSDYPKLVPHTPVVN
ncbi:DUF6562 domain-containing protein [Bacteroides fragilis]|uniref:DUF6562 domain-containing protein n=1 Tax=Bacteroides fragilis TaxID=817 RepID=UPI00321AC1C8